LVLGIAQHARADDFDPRCPGTAGVYLGNNSRQAWILRAGSVGSRKGGHAFQTIFDDGQTYVLHGQDRQKLRLAESEEGLAHWYGSIHWQAGTDLLPRWFQIMGDDGSPGPSFEFSHCEARQPPEAHRGRREFWE
jgi:hypothetical protein